MSGVGDLLVDDALFFREVPALKAFLAAPVYPQSGRRKSSTVARFAIR